MRHYLHIHRIVYILSRLLFRFYYYNKTYKLWFRSYAEVHEITAAMTKFSTTTVSLFVRVNERRRRQRQRRENMCSIGVLISFNNIANYERNISENARFPRKMSENVSNEVYKGT